jgi:3-oxoacyl-[acyl-carrier-protein] synthase-3
MSKKINTFISGTGSYAPPRVLTNFDLEKMVDTSDEWITARTGIKERRIVEDGTGPSDLSLEASKIALEEAQLRADQIDLILLGTVTPDYILPSTACILQDKLGAKNAAILDIVAACSGFIYGLSIASAFISIGQYKNVLVIGVETLSKIVNWKDRNTCVLFGDGAGAAVVSATTEDKGVLGTFLLGDGSLANLLHIPVGGAKIPLTKENIDLNEHFIHMEGTDVFKSAVRSMASAAEHVIQRVGITAEDVDLLIPHQANIRIIEALARRLKVPMNKVYVNIDRFGNTSAASVPIALDEARKKGMMKEGSISVLVAFGAGFTWGSAVIRW